MTIFRNKKSGLLYKIYLITPNWSRCTGYSYEAHPLFLNTTKVLKNIRLESFEKIALSPTSF